jgi:uncharacterized membrane protein YagU involved in acid resistance
MMRITAQFETDRLAQSRRSRFVKAAAAGVVGGLVGTWAMNQAQRVWSDAMDDRPPESAAGKHDARDWQERSENQNSNELAAQALATATIGRRLAERELAVAAAIVHFAFGAAVAGLYGVCVAPERRRTGLGVAMGIGLWLAADEFAMPRLGLSRPTSERPFEMHLQAFSAHVVYGFVTEVTRHAVRSVV